MTVYYSFQRLNSSIYRPISTGGRFKLLTGYIQSETGNRTNSHSARHLKIFQFNTMVLTAISPCQYKNIIIMNIFFTISQLQELFIYLIQFILIKRHSQHRKTILQSSTSTAGRQYNGVIINAHIFRVDNFISLYILQHTILMDPR